MTKKRRRIRPPKIERLQAEPLARPELTADRVLEELRRIAFADIRELLTEAGDLKPLHELSAETAACLASVDVVMRPAAAGDGQVERVVTIRFWDKVTALNILAQHFALLTDVVQVSGAGNGGGKECGDAGQGRATTDRADRPLAEARRRVH